MPAFSPASPSPSPALQGGGLQLRGPVSGVFLYPTVILFAEGAAGIATAKSLIQATSHSGGLNFKRRTDVRMYYRVRTATVAAGAGQCCHRSSSSRCGRLGGAALSGWQSGGSASSHSHPKRTHTRLHSPPQPPPSTSHAAPPLFHRRPTRPRCATGSSTTSGRSGTASRSSPPPATPLLTCLTTTRRSCE